MTPNPDFKISIFLKVKHLENGTRKSYTYKGRQIGSHDLLSHFKWCHNIFLVYSRRASRDLHHIWRGDRGLSHLCTRLTFLIRSLVSPLGAIENLRENTPTAGKCLYIGRLSPESDKTKNLKATYGRVGPIQTLRIS